MITINSKEEKSKGLDVPSTYSICEMVTLAKTVGTELLISEECRGTEGLAGGIVSMESTRNFLENLRSGLCSVTT